ncbi:hypothetical protein [Granulicoccus phenolivorans]|nr:hypothetical protein [Granulicoccus phenolivorans]
MSNFEFIRATLPAVHADCARAPSERVPWARSSGRWSVSTAAP